MKWILATNSHFNWGTSVKASYVTSHYLKAKPQTPLTVAVRAGIYGLTSRIPKVIGLAPNIRATLQYFGGSFLDAQKRTHEMLHPIPRVRGFFFVHKTIGVQHIHFIAHPPDSSRRLGVDNCLITYHLVGGLLGMFTDELKTRTRRVFEKRYKRRLTEGEVELILSQLIRFLRGLR